MGLEVGAVVEGKVTGITKFGAFVSLEGDKRGLVHISEVANSYVNDINEHLQEGQQVKVKIIGIDESGRINLSIKKALAPVHRPPARTPAYAASAPVSESASFEDKLKRFMQDSESRMCDLSRNGDKRGRGRSRRT